MKTIFTCLAALAVSHTVTVADPVYTDDGLMKLPEGYETWVFVGANLGIGYVGEAASQPPKFHNVYMETSAYQAFMASGTFADKTQFLFEVRTAADRIDDPVLNDGVFNADLLAVEVAVKDKNRPTYPGSTKEWAYYNFGRGADGAIQSTAKAFPDSVCWACHDQHAGYDKVWVQLYPRLKARLDQ